MTSSLKSAITLSRLSAHTLQMEWPTCSTKMLDIFVPSVIAESGGVHKMLFDIPGVSILDQPKPEPSPPEARKGRKRNGEHRDFMKMSDAKSKNSAHTSSQPLSHTNTKRDALHKKLSGARFRQLNELLYTCESKEAWKYFSDNAGDFVHYHSGWRSQQQKGWKMRPIDVIFRSIISDFKNHQHVSIADMGCGEGILAELLSKSKKYHVSSFDLVSTKPFIIACDTSRTPLKDDSMDVAVFSLSLMNVNYGDSLVEARRILHSGGRMYIAEVESRFEDNALEQFIAAMTKMGFTHNDTDSSHRIFILMRFTLTNKSVKTIPSQNWPRLKPCIYKRR